MTVPAWFVPLVVICSLAVNVLLVTSLIYSVRTYRKIKSDRGPR